MAGIKYALRPYEPVTVLEYVEFFRLWFYTTHQKNGAVAMKLGIEYALYKGDELLAMGTKREIAEQLGVSVNSVSHYGTPVYARRTSDNGRRLIEL